jgi:hypothetical protein
VALVTQSSGSTAPTDTFAFQFWADTSGANPILKVRNAANNAWVTLGRLDLESLGLNNLVSGASAPTVPFAFQFWVDTSGANPILKLRNAANSAWVTIGRADLTGFDFLPQEGGTMTGGIAYTNTDATYVPSGTTAQRPGSPSSGAIRYNTDLTTFEGYTGTQWASVGGGGLVVSTTQTVTGGGTINSSTTDNRQLRPVKGPTGGGSASTTPFGTGGGWKDGTEIILVGTDDADPIILTYNDASNGVIGNFSEIQITRGRVVTLIWVSTISRWVIIGGF